MDDTVITSEHTNDVHTAKPGLARGDVLQADLAIERGHRGQGELLGQEAPKVDDGGPKRRGALRETYCQVVFRS